MKTIGVIGILFLTTGFACQPADQKRASWAAVASTAPKPAAAGLPLRLKRSASRQKPAAVASLKRSSDEEKGPNKSPRRRSAGRDWMIENTRQEVLAGALKIMSINPPLCEIIIKPDSWRCKYGCDTEFTTKEEESRHTLYSHRIIPAGPEQDLGIDWGIIQRMHDRGEDTPQESDQDEGDEQEEVEEIEW